MMADSALEIADALVKRAERERNRPSHLDYLAANMLRKMADEQQTRRSMIDQTVRGIRNGMVEVKPEELKILDGVARELRDALKLARSTYDSKNLNTKLFTDLNAALLAAEFLLSHTLFTIEEREKA